MTDSSKLNRRQIMLGAGLVAIASGCSGGTAPAQTNDSPIVNEKPDAKAMVVDIYSKDFKNPDLSGTSILVTGSSSGFGRLAVEYFARQGAKVFATMRNLPRPEATELETLAANENLDISVIEIDVTRDDQVSAGVSKALDMNDGQLDVLINNAGISYAGPIEVQDMEATQHLFDTNVYGPHRMARAALPSMRASGSGLIINVTSQLGRLILPGFAMYSPTKFALEAMSEQMAYELVQHNIEVAVIQPGGYPTEIWENASALSEQLKSRLSDDQLKAYPQMTAGMGGGSGGNQSTDPMDIPRAMASIIAMEPGTRPLRMAVHPVLRPQEPINEVSAKQQLKWLGSSPYGASMKAVLD